MSKRLAVYVACLAILGGLAAPAVRAQEEGPQKDEHGHPHEWEHEHDWDVKWSDGHKMDKKDKAFSLKFGGRIQADYIFASQNDDIDEALGEDAFQNGFQFRRARLFFEGTVYERISFKAQYDFTGGDADFKDVWIALDMGPGALTFGHFKEFMSIEGITSSKYITFHERSHPVEVFWAERNSGVGYEGSSGPFTYGLGVFYDADDFGTSIDENRHDITGRFVFRPFESEDGKSLLHLGGAFSEKAIEAGGDLRFRGRPGNSFGPRPVDTGGIPADDASIYQLEIAGKAGRLWYASEYYITDVNSPNDAEVEPSQLNPTLDGWYVQAGFFLTDDHRPYKSSIAAWDRVKPSSPWLKNGGGGAWEVAARYDTVDLSEAQLNDQASELSSLTLQLNWYLNPVTRLMLGYVINDVDSMDGSFDGSVDSFLVRWQIDF